MKNNYFFLALPFALYNHLIIGASAVIYSVKAEIYRGKLRPECTSLDLLYCRQLYLGFAEMQKSVRQTFPLR